MTYGKKHGTGLRNIYIAAHMYQNITEQTFLFNLKVPSSEFPMY